MSERPHAIPNEWLVAYHDGELDDTRRTQLEAHLLTCASCQQELTALQSLTGVLAVDRLPASALTDQAARLAWSRLEPQLPDRAPVTLSPVRWLPGIGLLLASGLVQFGAATSVVVMLAASLLPWAARPLAWLGRVAASSVMGWLAWLLPDQWSGLGLATFFVVMSAWLAALYLVWLGYAWRYRRQAAVSLVT
jgi:anti-sigma factor RsiW